MNFLVSILIRSHQDGAFLEQNIRLLKRQLCAFDSSVFKLEFVHIDNASTDDSLSIIQHLNPHETLLNWRERYCPGKVLNEAIKACQGEYIVFHNADAIACDEYYLVHLLKPIVDGRCDLTFAQQIPRANAFPWVCHDYKRAFGEGRISANWNHFFSLASACVKASVVRENLFDETYEYSEDIEWSLRLKSKGVRILYEPLAKVEHSHNYNFSESYVRFFNEGVAASKMSLQKVSFIREIALRLPLALARDCLYMIKAFQLVLLPMALAHRCVQYYAYYRGHSCGEWRCKR